MKRLLLVGGGHAQLEILRELQRAPIPGVEAVLVTHIDGANRVAMVDNVAIPLDACSVNVGPAPAGTQVRGMREHALPLRPLANARVLLERMEALRARAGDARCVVVAMSLKDRIDRAFMARYAMV